MNVRYRKMHTQKIKYILRLSEGKLSFEEESHFSKEIISLEFILSQFFTFVEYSCVNFTDQFFIIDLFQSARGEHGPHQETI